MNDTGSWLGFACVLAFMPFITVGLIRKLKARLQARCGAPLLQPLFNLIKLIRKKETISADASWLFRASPTVMAACAMILACLVPWVSFKPACLGDDVFLVVYLLATIRFFTVLAALDTGSPFGAFGAEREVLLALLVEPAIVLSFAALAISAKSTSFSTIFTFAPALEIVSIAVWMLCGLGLFLCSLVELSRMPIDDPTTHLELTMVHEAMAIENSGPNLALSELTYSIRLVILYGLSAQCFLHALHAIWPFTQWTAAMLSVGMIFVLAVCTALVETLAVKLQWTKNPEFIAYCLTMALLASMAALIGGVIK